VAFQVGRPIPVAAKVRETTAGMKRWTWFRLSTAPFGVSDFKNDIVAAHMSSPRARDGPASRRITSETARYATAVVPSATESIAHTEGCRRKPEPRPSFHSSCRSSLSLQRESVCLPGTPPEELLPSSCKAYSSCLGSVGQSKHRDLSRCIVLRVPDNHEGRQW